MLPVVENEHAVDNFGGAFDGDFAGRIPNQLVDKTGARDSSRPVPDNSPPFSYVFCDTNRGHVRVLVGQKFNVAGFRQPECHGGGYVNDKASMLGLACGFRLDIDGDYWRKRGCGCGSLKYLKFTHKEILPQGQKCY